MKKIVFVSEVKDPYSSKSSTNIMTKNLIIGFKDLGFEVNLIGIFDKDADEKNIHREYDELVDDYILVQSILNLSLSRNKYNQIFKMLKQSLKTEKYKNIIPRFDFFEDAILISHTPSVEAAFICKEIKKTYKGMTYIQYWSDPITLSGITLDKFSMKRYIHYAVEKSILSFSDRIVYFTEPLMEQQKRLFKKYEKIMYHSAGSYIKSDQNLDSSAQKERLLFGYSGSYNPKVRNIIPLYEAFSSNKNADLQIVGHKFINLENKENITVYDEVSESEIEKIEKQFDVIITLLNYNTLQLPGKVFYRVNTNKIILVILDGNYSERIKRYLSKYSRFIFCENNCKSINEAINKIINKEYSLNSSDVEKLSPKNIAKEILGEEFLKC